MLIKKLCSKTFLTECWEEIYNSKPYLIRNKSRGIDNVSLEEFEREKTKSIQEIAISLKRGFYKFEPLKGIYFEKEKKGKYRLLSVPTVRDRILHRGILKLITPIIYRHINTGVSYCGVIKNSKKNSKKTGLNSRKAIKQLTIEVKKKRYWIFESDIQSFFDLVPKQKIYKKIIKILHADRSLNHLIKQIIFFEIGNIEKIKADKRYSTVFPPNSKTGISQGSSLSPIFSNIYLAQFDLHMKKLCGKSLIRYVDDFVILAKNRETVEELGKKAQKFLKRENLTLATDKTFIKNLKHESVKFLGLKLNNKEIIPKKTSGEIKEKFTSKILKFNNYEDVIRKGKKITKIDQMNERIQSWGNCYKFYHVKNIFEDLDKTINEVKSKNPQFNSIENLQKIELEPLINIDEWQKLFQN